MVSPDDRRTEDMLADIHRLRIQSAQSRDEANASQIEAERLRDQLQARLSSIEAERAEMLQQARTQLRAEADALRSDVRALRARLRACASPLEAIAELEEEAIALAVGVEGDVEPSPPAPVSEPQGIAPGDIVWLQQLNASGRVLQIAGPEAEVQVGPARTRVALSSLALRERAATSEPGRGAGETAIRYSAATSPGVRVDLRGLAADDALQRLDRHLDAGWRAGLPWLHIVHGKGTGTLRRAVREFLSDHPLVSSYEPGRPKEGGAGVTVAKLVAT
jgi:DNA mismatch repair protein MutS2